MGIADQVTHATVADVDPFRDFAAVRGGPSVGVVAHARRVGIVGSRDFPEMDRVAALVDLLRPDATVISGGARGVDNAAVTYAIATDRQGIEVRPRVRQGHAAEDLKNRNEVIVLGSDVVVAFWDGQSHGTAHTIRKALELIGYVIVVLPGLPPETWEACR